MYIIKKFIVLRKVSETFWDMARKLGHPDKPNPQQSARNLPGQEDKQTNYQLFHANQNQKPHM